MEELNHTFDLGQLKEQLANGTNRKTELWNLLMKAGTEVNSAQNNLNDAKDVYMKVKVQIRQCDEKIKSLKVMINTERQFGS